MGYNIVLLIVGIFIVAVSMYIILKENEKSYNRNNEDIIMTEFTRYNNTAHGSTQFTTINKKIELLEEDILEIRKDLKRLFDIYQQAKEAAAALYPPNTIKEKEIEQPFNQTLNYNLFIQKNKEILQLFNEGNKPEEIAKKLNKSIREIEMVIKLIK